MKRKTFMQSLSRSSRYVVLTLIVLIVTSCGAQDSSTGTDNGGDNGGTTGDSSSTAGVLCDLSQSVFNDSASVQQTSTSEWSCSDTERLLTGNGIPDHEVGTFPNAGNPNTISEQSISATLTLTPVETDTATELGGPRGAVAYAINGVKFDPGTAETCDDSGTDCSLGGGTGGAWNIEALSQTSFNFGVDDNNAHVQPTGEYHYHGLPEGIVTNLNKGEAMTLVGWAADGFPVYARYGYTDAMDATSAIKMMTGSYQLKATPDENRPSTDLYEMGTFNQDWEYVAGSGDLDECNGRTGVTPEFPEGIYHYYATDTYPFLQRCVTGEVTVAAGPGGPPPGGAPPRGTPPGQ
ncbi:MAG: YHYH protein [Trueperaceae bacterium]